MSISTTPEVSHLVSLTHYLLYKLNRHRGKNEIFLYTSLSLIAVDTVSQLYDLYVGEVGEQRNAADGCQAEEDSCGVSIPHKPYGDCGVNGACTGSFHGEARCVCKLGWRGTSCDIRKF